MEEHYTSELNIEVSGIHHPGDFFAFVPEYAARIDSALELRAESGITAVLQIVVYNETEVGFLLNDEALQTSYYPNKGLLTTTQPYELTLSIINNISNKYRYVMENSERFSWDSFEDHDISATITGEFSFNGHHSFYSQDGFPRFTQKPKIDIYGRVVRISRQVWAF